ncbi:hypothetical protein NKDENANG_00522 [Candidatus Entotheonellaceae bacterium PAL068K]
MGTWTRKRGEAGFTLLEVVVALAIVALTLVPLLRLHLLSLDATVRAQDLTTAVLLAQGQMAAQGTFPDPGEETGTYDDPELARYRWQSVVTEYTFDAASNGTRVDVRHIEITVHWSDGQSERHYTLEAYASR